MLKKYKKTISECKDSKRSLMFGKGNFKIIHTLNGNFTKEEGYHVMAEYLDEHGADFEAVFCHNDDMMSVVVDALKEHGYMPGEDINTPAAANLDRKC